MGLLLMPMLRHRPARHRPSWPRSILWLFPVLGLVPLHSPSCCRRLMRGERATTATAAAAATTFS